MVAWLDSADDRLQQPPSTSFIVAQTRGHPERTPTASKPQPPQLRRRRVHTGGACLAIDEDCAVFASVAQTH